MIGPELLQGQGMVCFKVLFLYGQKLEERNLYEHDDYVIVVRLALEGTAGVGWGDVPDEHPDRNDRHQEPHQQEHFEDR